MPRLEHESCNPKSINRGTINHLEARAFKDPVGETPTGAENDETPTGAENDETPTGAKNSKT